MISYQNFTRLLAESQKYETLDACIAECGGSVNADQIDAEIELLATIWEFARDGLSIDGIMQINNATMRDLSRKYNIPYRTIQDWKAGVRNPPEWALPMIAYAVLSDTIKGE